MLQLSFLIRTSSDQRLFASSPRLIAGCHVLRRLSMPRHPPCTLINLTTFTDYRHLRQLSVVRCQLLVKTKAEAFITTANSQLTTHNLQKPAGVRKTITNASNGTYSPKRCSTTSSLNFSDLRKDFKSRSERKASRSVHQNSIPTLGCRNGTRSDKP